LKIGFKKYFNEKTDEILEIYNLYNENDEKVIIFF